MVWKLSTLVGAAMLGQAAMAQTDWQPLKDILGDKLIAGKPLAQVCLEDDEAACIEAKTMYLDEQYRTDHPGSQIQTQWETCQSTGAQCLLDYTNKTDAETVLAQTGCELGSISDYYIKVETADDVRVGMQFAKENNIPFLVKNTGHDYKGRSSAPGSLAAWTHNLKSLEYIKDFVPEGSTDDTSHEVFTLGAGVQFIELFKYAEENNVTFIGGAEQTVGAGGGWLLGGGHSFLSPTYGLGVDRVVQFKVVTPDSELRVANAYQNQDLFWALRGGGAAFGVVLESTTLVAPQVTVQACFISWDPTTLDTETAARLSKEYLTIITDNMPTWAEQGWGGGSRAYVGSFLTTEINKEEAAAALAPLAKFAEDNKGIVNYVQNEYPSYYSYFKVFTAANGAIVGKPIAQTTRLVPASNFNSTESRAELVDAMLEAYALAPSFLILITAPYNFEYEEGATSVTEAWRDTYYHISVVTGWNWDASQEEIKAAYENSIKAIAPIRAITPDAAYQNEADIYEPNYEVSFWGTNYERLLSIKNEVDPDHLLDCWQCVGWEPSAPRFSCYLPE